MSERTIGYTRTKREKREGSSEGHEESYREKEEKDRGLNGLDDRRPSTNTDEDERITMDDGLLLEKALAHEESVLHSFDSSSIESIAGVKGSRIAHGAHKYL